VGSQNPVDAFISLPEQMLQAAACASVDLLKHRLLQMHRRLNQAWSAKAQLEKTSDSAPSKFSVRTMATGSIDDFHKGLQDRIGKPVFLSSMYLLSAVHA